MRAALFLFLLFLSQALLDVKADDRAVIWSNGGEFELGSAVPGELVLEGEDVFAVQYDSAGQKVIIAAGTYGKGRIVAFAHGAFILEGKMPKPAQDLVRRLSDWAGNESDGKKVAFHPAVKGSLLGGEAMEPSQLSKGSVQTYVVMAHAGRWTGADANAVLDFVKNGGGLLVATTPWAFSGKFDDFSQFLGNALIRPAGLSYHPNSYARGEVPLIVSRVDTPLSEIQANWHAMGKVWPSEHELVKRLDQVIVNHGSMTAAEKERFASELRKVSQIKGSEIIPVLDRLRKLNHALGPIIPTKAAPVTPGEDPLVDALMALETDLNQTLPAGGMYPIPAAADYPGTAINEHPDLDREVMINGDYRGWLSGRTAGGWRAKEMRPTGVYALPGEVIQVRIPEALSGQGYEVQIGAYAGGLKNRSKWYRYPRLVNSRALDHMETRISNGFG
ncbi:MAG: M60 family peptidase N-terminal accessory domain-containing protein, partial [Verrucomicrobiota bacterium]